MTDKQRLLELFRNSGGRLISCNELVDGQFYGNKRIIEYTGRIADARKEMGCTCGKDQDSCQAEEHIINVKTNWYQYKSNKVEQPKPRQILTSLNVEKRLNDLRKQWTAAKERKDQKEMFRIELMANTLTLALHTKKQEQIEPNQNELISLAQELLT